MKLWRIITVNLLVAAALALFLSLTAAAPPDLAPGGAVVPLGEAQVDLRGTYAATLRRVYGGGRVRWLAPGAAISDTAVLSDAVRPGDLYLPPGEAGVEFCAGCTYHALAGAVPLTRAYALQPGKVAIFRSSVTYTVGADGEGVAMWEYAVMRQLFDGYLRGAVPYTTLDEEGLAGAPPDYDVLILPAFNREQTDDVLGALGEGGLAAIRDFVVRGGTLYAQGTGLLIAEAAGAMPSVSVADEEVVGLTGEAAFDSAGRLRVTAPGSPLAWSWLTDTLYVLDDPVVYPGDDVEVVAELANAANGDAVPAIFRAPYEAGHGQVIGVVGHPTDPLRRNQVPLFMDAIFLALSGYADLYGDAVQTFNPDYPPHEFPAYEEVPVSATLHVENLWDAALARVVVTETLSPGYILTGTVTPPPTGVLTTPLGGTVLIWDLGDLAPRAGVTLSWQAVTSPTVLAAGVGTFSQGEMTYVGPGGTPMTTDHPPFVLTSQMAARLVGDRDLEADRHYRIRDDGVYLDVALSLENKEQTPAFDVVVKEWVYLISPIVDVGNQHVILSANDGETIWMRNEPYLWGERYPLWDGAAAPTQTLTLDDWQGDWCVFTSAHGIHIDPPPLRQGDVITDYGSFVTIPVSYTDVVTVSGDDELLLPCMPITWTLGALNGYEYREPAVRYGVHSRELLGREVVFHGTPREGTVVMPHDAGSVFVAAGTDPVPFREHLAAAVPYAPQPPSLPVAMWQDVWSRTHTMTLRTIFYDTWDWDACATCGGDLSEQHAGFAVTFGIWADTDGDGIEEPVKEIPTRLSEAQVRLLGKTYSTNAGDFDFTIPEGENLIELPIFRGLGVKIGPQGATWYDAWRDVGPGKTELFTVVEEVAYDHLFFRQTIPAGSWASFVVSATVDNYDFNREGLYKLHDGGRLVYRQPIAGPNRYEVYDAHVHAAEGWRSDAEVDKRGGPTLVSVYSDTVFLDYTVTDPYEPRSGWAFEHAYDPYLKSWGYGDLVWTTYVGGSEAKTLFRTILRRGDRTRVRVALDNNTGVTLTNLSVALDAPEGIEVTRLYTDPTTAPEPVWPELSFLNRTAVPDAWRSVWYFELEVGDVAENLWDTLVEIPVEVSADGLDAEHVAPPARLFLQRDAAPTFVSAPAHALVLTDTLPAEVRLDAAVLVTDPAVVDELWLALDVDAGDITSESANGLFESLAPTRAMTVAYEVVDGVATFVLPDALRHVPAAQDWHLIAKTTLLRARHGTNLVNEGPVIAYRDPFETAWSHQGPAVTVEAHGAAVWTDYDCGGGYVPSSLPASEHVTVRDGVCAIPSYGPSEVVVNVTGYNPGDAIARGVTVTLALPESVTVTEAVPPWVALGPQAVTWRLGDLAPGAARRFEVVLYVTPDETAWREMMVFSPMGMNSDVIGQLLAIDHTDGEFTDDYSQQIVRGQVGGAFWFDVRFVPLPIYLPSVMRNYDPRPDLVVTEVTVDSEDPQRTFVTIANVGNGTAHDFWVDLYFDPASPPEVNQPWATLNPGYGGAAWFVDVLTPGEALELTLTDDYLVASQSRWPVAYPTGDHAVWAFVDSWGYPNVWAGVVEADEANNRHGPVKITIAGADATYSDLDDLPPIPSRTRYPEGGE